MLSGSVAARLRRNLIGDRAFYDRVVTIALPIIISVMELISRLMSL